MRPLPSSPIILYVLMLYTCDFVHFHLSSQLLLVHSHVMSFSHPLSWSVLHFIFYFPWYCLYKVFNLQDFWCLCICVGTVKAMIMEAYRLLLTSNSKIVYGKSSRAKPCRMLSLPALFLLYVYCHLLSFNTLSLSLHHLIHSSSHLSCSLLCSLLLLPFPALHLIEIWLHRFICGTLEQAKHWQ